MTFRKQRLPIIVRTADIGRKLNYNQMVELGQKRHFWGQINKNLGFYTSEQLEDLSRRIKTEGNYDSRDKYVEKDNGKFIVNSTNPNIVHCCTCHNNPQRYSQGQQRCQFCIEYQRAKSTLRISTDMDNPQQQKKDSANGRQKRFVDEVIQVSLPRLKHHTQRNHDNCKACKQKKVNRQMQSVSTKKIKGVSIGLKSVQLSGLSSVKASKGRRFIF